FKIDGVHSGKYNASVLAMFDESNLYSDTATFEITTADATGVEIKTHKGLSASGVAVIEGNDDPAVSALLPQVQLLAATMATESFSGIGLSRATVAPDGTFTVSGLRPGRFMIMTSPMAQDSRFSILRTERGGVAQNEGIEISPDSPVNDIKLVLGYRNCAIFGRVTLSGGAIIKGTGVNVSIRRVAAGDEGTGTYAYAAEHYVAMAMGGASGSSREFTVSPGGDFRADSLVPGDYEVAARFMDKPGTRDADMKSATQKVTLTSGSQAEVNLVLDLSSKK